MRRRNGNHGFTLLELMITVLVLAILSAIAINSYQEQIRKGRRAEAYSVVSTMQLAMERWRAENPSYAACTPTPCGSGTYPALGTSKYYTFALSGANATTYTLTATRTAGSPQANDKCGTLTANGNAKPSWATASCN